MGSLSVERYYILKKFGCLLVGQLPSHKLKLVGIIQILINNMWHLHLVLCCIMEILGNFAYLLHDEEAGGYDLLLTLYFGWISC